jgi:hypothetical protein
MSVYQKTSGSPLLYDAVTNDVVGMKDPDGSEWLFSSPVGTKTNDDAIAGNVGEYVSSTVLVANAVSMVTNVGKTVTSITLTPGDWDVTGLVGSRTAATTSISHTSQSISLVDNTMGGIGNETSRNNGAYVPGALSFLGVTPVVRISIATTTVVYMVAHALFTIAAVDCYGVLRARRVR